MARRQPLRAFSFMPQSYMALTKADAEYLLRSMEFRQHTDKQAKLLVGNLEEYLERFEQPRMKRENAIRKLAHKTLHQEGDLEIDDNVVISEGDDNGAYVMTWQWVAFDGTKFDKEKAK